MDMSNNNEEIRYIVYVGRYNDGFYSDHWVDKSPFFIEDIVGIYKTLEKAQELCRQRKDLKYTSITWEL